MYYVLVGLTCINNYIKSYWSTVLLFHSLLRDALYAFKCLITFIKYVKLYCIYFAVDGHDILNWNDLIRLKNYCTTNLPILYRRYGLLVIEYHTLFIAVPFM